MNIYYIIYFLKSQDTIRKTKNKRNKKRYNNYNAKIFCVG